MRSYLRYLAIFAILLHSLAYAAGAPGLQGATITVTTLVDELNADGDCSLRESIQAANADTPVDACPAGAGADTIVLGVGTYMLSRAGADEDENQTGDLDLAGALTIRGIDYNTTIINASGLGDRAFQILPGASAALQRLRITGGGDSTNALFDGGAILIDAATATLTNVDIANSAAGRNGGGIHNAGGQLTVADSLVRDSTAGVMNSNSGSGGGIYSAGGSVVIDSSIVNDNTARDGGGIFSAGQLHVSDSWIHDNATDANGAGIYSSATAAITGTVLDSNRASGHGGNIYSGEADESSMLTLVSSELREGQADLGAGIYNQGALEVHSSSFALNSAGSGSALYSLAQIQPGELRNATIVSNTVSAGASGAIDNAGGAAIVLYNTLLGQNGAKPNCAGVFTSGGHNLDFGNSCGFDASGANGDKINTDPLLGALPIVKSTPGTFPVGIGSPAVNAGNNATCAALDIFQHRRPHGVNCDIGAFEMNTEPTAGSAESYTTAEDTPLIVAAPGVLSNDADPDNDPLSAILDNPPTHGTFSLAANGSFAYSPAANYYGTDHFVYRASDGALATAQVIVSINVAPVNDPPAVKNDAFSIIKPTPFAISTAALLLNDTDIENDGLFVSAAGPISARGGSAILNGATITYTPPRNYTGPDSFSYSVSDGHGGVSNGVVNITINTRYIFLPLTRR